MREENIYEFKQSSVEQTNMGEPLSEVFVSAIDLLEIHIRAKIREILTKIANKTPKLGIMAILSLPIIFGMACYGLVFNGLCLAYRTAFPELIAEAVNSLAHGTLLLVILLLGWALIKSLPKLFKV